MNSNYSLFMNVWPWIGLGAGVVLLITAFCTDWLRKDLSINRWFDPAWLAWLGAIEYMLHNVEEYGIDITGATLPFPTVMRETMGVIMPEFFFLAVNLVMIWVAGPLIAAFTRKYKFCAPAMAIFAFINAITHIVAGIKTGYNPGVLTSFLFFIPLFIWTFYVCFIRNKWQISLLWKGALIGILYHAILFIGIFCVRTGIISGITDGWIMILNGIIFISLWYMLGKQNKKADMIISNNV